ITTTSPSSSGRPAPASGVTRSRSPSRSAGAMLTPLSAIHVPSGCAPDRQTPSSQRPVCVSNHSRLYAATTRGATGKCVWGAPGRVYSGGVDLILACARTRLCKAERERITTLAEAETDWPEVVLRARDHGVAPLVQRALERVCPTAPPEPA